MMETTWIAELKEVLRDGLDRREPVDVYWLAKQQATSVRTLQRKIGQKGVRFRDLIREARHAQAQRLLAESPGMPLNEVAQRCGFTGSSALARAFKTWTGVAPRAYRAAQSAPSSGETAVAA